MSQTGSEQNRVTIRMIAAKLGVSHTTVSRALRDDPRISQATRRRVQGLSDQLNYTPNRAGSALSTGRTYTLAFIVPDDLDDFPRLFLTDYLEGFTKAVAPHGYSVQLVLAPALQRHQHSLSDLLVSADVDGAAVLLGRARHDELQHAASRRKFPIVLVNQAAQPDLEMDSVTADDKMGASAAVLHLIDQNHSRIAYIGGPEDIIPCQQRHLGYLAALHERHITPSRELIVTTEQTRKHGFEAMSALLDGPGDFTAVFCGVDVIALGAVEAIKARGMSVPSNVSVVGFDDDSFADMMTPPLSTVRKPRIQIGFEAGRLLIARATEDRTPARQIDLPTELIVRNSTAKSSK